jgi:hypothetical protein
VALAEPPERKVFSDPDSGRTIWQLTQGKLESKHSYYDLCPWNHDGRFLVVSSVDPSLLALREGKSGSAFGEPMVSNEGIVRIIDTWDWTIRTVARNASYNSHTGGFALWHPARNQLLFHRPDGVGILDIDSGAESLLEGAARQLSPDGKLTVFTRNEPDDSAVYTAEVDNSAITGIVDKQTLYDLTPNKDEFTPEEMTVGNTKWRPDGEYIVLANWVHSKWPNVRRNLYIVKKDGSEVRWLCHYGHHHSWTPDGNSLLFYDWVSGSGWRPTTVDFNGSNRRVLIDQPLGSHPLMAADGNKVIDWDEKGILVLRIREQTVERIATFRNKFRMDITGTHPHAVWNREGTQVLYNSAETGQSEVYLIPNVT